MCCTEPGLTEALYINCIYCKRQTRPVAREGAPHQQTLSCLTEIKILS
jgi:hypothetical protein